MAPSSPETDFAVRDAITADDYFIIAGPTASGKSALAIDLAKAVDGIIVNADSMQIYQDLRLITARPSVADEARCEHTLYGVLDGAERASVRLWLGLAADAFAAIRARGKTPILVGGTGMYVNAAQFGIAPMPDVPATIHAECVDELASIGGARFRAALAKDDPVTAARLVDGDGQRLVRAMGVVRATGRPISAWQQDPHEYMLAGNPHTIAVLPPREELYQRINSRFEIMMGEGAMDEVIALGVRNLDPDLPVMKALGVRELLACHRGELSIEKAIELAQRDSRHYAKRQMTWLRNNFNAKIELNEKYSESFLKKIFSDIIT
ncbi:tRNA (adenosine(37)-N6)-dimethylallyltransferase MiaA [Alphaproteobacteria bacterium]|nr:tRNA (adenosine(37)-N6)-dimethylallyltransferase MiaA [Alphaproteobacteria bacterium]